MKLKEKCIYYNPVQEGYYLVLSVDDEMVYGRRGVYKKTSNLEDWISQGKWGFIFKIDDIIIDSNNIRNYYLDEECLEQFKLVKELSDEEFYPIEILSHTSYNLPTFLVDINKDRNTNLINAIVKDIKERELKIKQLNSEILNLTCGLCDLMK